ncbi:mucin-associated surface protein [Arthrobacter sp. ISL-28]|nr:mucin-associated surface protein [Arthrobacter sp. ISL-28]
MIRHERLPPRPARRLRASAVLAAGMLALGATGCGGTASELESDAAAQLQQRVLAVTKAAAANNPATALKSLSQLSSDLDAAAAAGHVSFKRHRSITVAIDSVKADLAAAQAAGKAAAEAAAKARAADERAPAIVVPAPAPAPASGVRGNPEKGHWDEDTDNDHRSLKEKD